MLKFNSFFKFSIFNNEQSPTPDIAIFRIYIQPYNEQRGDGGKEKLPETRNLVSYSAKWDAEYFNVGYLKEQTEIQEEHPTRKDRLG